MNALTKEFDVFAIPHAIVRVKRPRLVGRHAAWVSMRGNRWWAPVSDGDILAVCRNEYTDTRREAIIRTCMQQAVGVRTGERREKGD